MLIYLESKYNACFKIENRVEKPFETEDIFTIIVQ